MSVAGSAFTKALWKKERVPKQSNYLAHILAGIVSLFAEKAKWVPDL